MHNIVEKFAVKGEPTSCERFGHGHINLTYIVTCSSGAVYILQRINKNIFKDPVSLMENIAGVTGYLREHSTNAREVLTLIPTLYGLPFFLDGEGEYWRMYDFVTDSLCLQRAESLSDFCESAAAFGRFQNMLADYPASTLHETIPHFHDTIVRFSNLIKSIREDASGRAAAVAKEIEFALSYEKFAHTLVDMTASGELPIRVTHNDTKLNNVLFDLNTRKGVCVIDLDTVMPGLAVNDFGDSIRFGACTAAEDEKDTAKVSLDLALYKSYLEGFLSECGGSLTPAEIDMLPVGAKMMTLECGVRFLTDYLDGDIYFKTAYPEHNLDRCRTQFALAADMDRKWQQMQNILVEAKAHGTLRN